MTTTTTSTGITTTKTPNASTSPVAATHPAAASTIASIVNVGSGTTPDTINNAGVIAWAQQAALLTTDTPPAFTTEAVGNPTGIVENFAHGVFNAVAFRKELEKQAILSGQNSIATELDVLNRVDALLHSAQLAGFTFTVTLENGKPVPAVQKSVKPVTPVTPATTTGASSTVPVSSASGT